MLPLTHQNKNQQAQARTKRTYLSILISSAMGVLLLFYGLNFYLGDDLGALTAGLRPSAPAVSFQTLTGQSIKLANWQGHPVIVQFWATSCVTCIQEMPQWVEHYPRWHAQGLEMVAVAMNYDNSNYVHELAQRYQLPFHVVHDTDRNANQQLAQAFGGVNLTPTSFVIDPSGRIAKRYIGTPDFSELETLLKGWFPLSVSTK
jgi:peroxiredoxin